MNFAKALVPFFSYPMIVTYDFAILFMFAKIRTSIRIREWNADMSKYKKQTVRGSTKTAEFASLNGQSDLGVGAGVS